MYQREDIETINLNEEITDQDTRQLKFRLKSTSNNYQISIFKLFQFSEVIQNEMFSSSIFEQLSNKISGMLNANIIKEESFQLFWQILQGEQVNISSSHFWDLCKLSNVFQINSLKRCLEKYIKKHSKDINFILNLLIERESLNQPKEYFELLDSNFRYSEEMEECLTSNIVKCIENPLFGSLHISTIHRILSKIDIEKIPNETIYDFISSSIEERYILLSYIKIEKLSDEKFQNLFEKYKRSIEMKKNNFFDYLPCDLIYIKKLKGIIKDMEEEKEEIQKAHEKEIKELTNKNNKLITSQNILEHETKEKQEQITKLGEEKEKQINELMIQNKEKQEQITKLGEEKKSK